MSQLLKYKTVVPALGPVTPSSSTPDYISLKNASHVTVLIQALNGSTVTGSAITLLQATAVAGTSEKALAFSKMWSNVAPATNSNWTENAVSSNTFTTATTNSALLGYIIEVPAESLDTNNGFDCFRVGTGNAANTTVSVTYIVTPRENVNGTGPNLVVD